MTGQNYNHNCKDKLNQAELRATPARLAVMKLLETTKTPVDVNMIIGYLKKQKIKTDPATAFRIINLFTDRGLTKQIFFHESKSRYELSTKKDHHHLICENCGHIEDIFDCRIPELEKQIQTDKEFNVKSHSLEFFGMCIKCQSRLNRNLA